MPKVADGKLIMRTFLLGFVIFLFGTASFSAQWIKQTVNTTASLRSLSVVNERVVWASGTGGTVIKTIDSGKTWKVMTVAGAEKLDFRDIESFDANTAYILSIGNGESSRIYKTTDGGKSWYAGEGLTGYRSAVTYIDDKTIIAVGTNGTDISYNRGVSWKKIGSENLNAIAAMGKKAVLSVGPNGSLAVLTR